MGYGSEVCSWQDPSPRPNQAPSPRGVLLVGLSSSPSSRGCKLCQPEPLAGMTWSPHLFPQLPAWPLRLTQNRLRLQLRGKKEGAGRRPDLQAQSLVPSGFFSTLV